MVCGATSREESRWSRSQTSSVEDGADCRSSTTTSRTSRTTSRSSSLPARAASSAGSSWASGGVPSEGRGNHTSSTVPAEESVARPKPQAAVGGVVVTGPAYGRPGGAGAPGGGGWAQRRPKLRSSARPWGPTLLLLVVRAKTFALFAS